VFLSCRISVLGTWKSELIKAQFAARPRGFQCTPASPSIIQSYCDASDPYCCTGNDANSHQQYVNKYGQQAMAFIKKLVDAA
jgi:acetylxylan esterase